MQYLVLGANGYIGSYIFRQLKKHGFHVLGTSRREEHTAEHMISFDIQKDHIDDILKEITEQEKMAIVCIAQPNIDGCVRNYEQSYDINVNKTKRLVGELSDAGFSILYFSTDNVFDGMDGNYTEESKTCPINKYGSMKKEMEDYLLECMPEACILRISKVVSTEQAKQNIFTEWMRQEKEGKVRCIRDNRLSFVCMDDVYHACLIVAEKKMHGLYNIVGDQDYSRAELARKFYSKLGNSMEICECSLEEFGFFDYRPLNISMSNQKFKNATGYQFMSMDVVIEKFLENERRSICTGRD